MAFRPSGPASLKLLHIAIAAEALSLALASLYLADKGVLRHARSFRSTYIRNYSGRRDSRASRLGFRELTSLWSKSTQSDATSAST